MSAKNAISVQWEHASPQDSFNQASFVKGQRIMELVSPMDDIVAGLDILELNCSVDPDMVIYPALPWISGLLEGFAEDERPYPPVQKCYDVLKTLAEAHPKHWPEIYQVLDEHKDDRNLSRALKKQVNRTMNDISKNIAKCNKLGIVPFQDPNALIVTDTTPVTYEIV